LIFKLCFYKTILFNHHLVVVFYTVRLFADYLAFISKVGHYYVCLRFATVKSWVILS